MAQSELPIILQDAPSHFNWDLESGTCKTFEALDLNIKEHIQFNPNEMPVQAHLFRSFLYMSSFVNPTPDFKRFQNHLKDAYEKIETLADEDERSAYTLVAKCNEAIVARRLKAPNTEIEDDIEDRIEHLTDKSWACIHSVRAFALSRLGLPKYKDTELFYRLATKVYPEKTDWLFGLALVIGRQARHTAPAYTFTQEMEEEKALLEKLLTLDCNHALAHATLSECLLLKRDNDGAKEHANKAVEREPNNTYILSIVGKIFRRMRHYDVAIKLFQQACALKSNDPFLHHQHGLVYRDKIKITRNRRQKTDLQRKALHCFTKAVQANSTNTMARLDKARAHADLGENDKADEEYTHLIATDNLSPNYRFTFNYRYATFLRAKRNDDKKAAKHLRTAIDLAVTHCTTEPVTRTNPTPKFTGLANDFKTASQNFREIMDTLVESDNTQSQTEGLSGIGWLHQVLGEYEAAKEKYQAYLKREGKGKDHTVIQQLIRCLIQLDDLEEARKQIDLLQKIKPRLWQDCHVECILREGEIALTDPDQKENAKDLFREAVRLGSMDGCAKLADILDDICQFDKTVLTTWELRSDCAKILHCCVKNNKTGCPLYSRVERLMHLEDEIFGTLRKLHLDMELDLLKPCNADQGLKEVLRKAVQVIDEARPPLNHIMRDFQKKYYKKSKNSHLEFFYIAHQGTSTPMQEQAHQAVRDAVVDIAHQGTSTPMQEEACKAVRDAVVDKLMKKYKWTNFHTQFSELLNFMVQIQPAYPGNDNWFVAFFQMRNLKQHLHRVHHRKYHIPVILNGKLAKDVEPIPDGPNGPTESKVPGVTYEEFDVIEVARRATTEVERIVGEFHKYL